MKRNVMLGLMLLFSTLVFGQHRTKDPKQFSAQRTAEMKNVLALNETQYATIKGINEKYASKFMVLRRDSVASREDKHREMKSLRD